MALLDFMRLKLHKNRKYASSDIIDALVMNSTAFREGTMEIKQYCIDNKPKQVGCLGEFKFSDALVRGYEDTERYRSPFLITSETFEEYITYALKRDSLKKRNNIIEMIPNHQRQYDHNKLSKMKIPFGVGELVTIPDIFHVGRFSDNILEITDILYLFNSRTPGGILDIPSTVHDFRNRPILLGSTFLTETFDEEYIRFFEDKTKRFYDDGSVKFFTYNPNQENEDLITMMMDLNWVIESVAHQIYGIKPENLSISLLHGTSSVFSTIMIDVLDTRMVAVYNKELANLVNLLRVLIYNLSTYCIVKSDAKLLKRFSLIHIMNMECINRMLNAYKKTSKIEDYLEIYEEYQQLLIPETYKPLLKAQH